jgi:hypothetical protein
VTGTRREIALTLPFYSALLVLYAWPVVSQITSHVPVTGNVIRAFSGLYTITWGIHALANQPLHFFQCNVLYPHANALAFGEPLFGMAVALAPVQWIFMNPTFTYNLAVLLSFVIAATGAYLLGRLITGSFRAGLLAGLLYGFSPWRFSEVDHLDGLGLMLLPWVFLVGHLYLETRTRRMIYLGAFFAFVQCATSLSSVALLAGSAIAALGYSGYRQKRRHRVLFWIHRGHFAVAALAFVVAVSFFVKPWLEHALNERWWITPVAAQPERIGSQLSQMGFLPMISTLRPFHSPGFGALLLIGLLGLGALRPRDEDDHRVFFYGFLGAAALVIQFFSPWDLGAVLSLSATILAAISYSRLEVLLRPSRSGNVLVTAILAVVAVELHPYAVTTAESIPRTGPPAEYLWLSETDPESVVIEVPAGPASTSSTETLARRQLYSIFHWRRKVDGALEHVPARTVGIRSRLQGFPDDASIAQIHAIHVDYVIVHLDEYAPDERERMIGALESRAELRLEASFADARVYRVE